MQKQQQHPLEMTAGEPVQLQEDHSLLEAVRRAVKGEDSTAGSGFCFTRWINLLQMDTTWTRFW